VIELGPPKRGLSPGDDAGILVDVRELEEGDAWQMLIRRHDEY
jgi:hypothetical protein